jgi:hypothetical protein
VEFLVVGGATLVLFPIAWLLRAALGLDWSEYGVSFVAFYAAWVINDPHFSVTYLLFYKNARRRALGDVFSPAQRARYWIAGLFVPLALGAWAAAALTTNSGPTLGLLIQLMFFLVGWHYVKQGFGVLTVLSARRGVRFSTLERNVVLFHAFAGWLYAWSSPAEPGGRQFSEKGVVYTALAHPAGLELVTGIGFALSTLALVLVLARKWRSEKRLPPLAPLSGFLVTVWLWTVYSGIDPLMIYVIPALHSVQYLYFVWLLGRNEARAAEGPPNFGRPVAVRLGMLAASALALGWLLFHGAPSFFDDAFALRTSPDPDQVGGLGATPYFAAIFAFVNIHHYFMDHVIWRRDNPDTRFLRDG